MNRIAIDLAAILLAVRVFAYILLWGVFGTRSIEGFVTFAIGAAAVELLYFGYKKINKAIVKAKVRKSNKESMNFYIVDKNGVLEPSTMEASEAFIEKVIDGVSDRAEEEHKTLHDTLEVKPVMRHKHFGQVCVSCLFIGRSPKTEKVPKPWVVTAKVAAGPLEGITVYEKYLPSWDDAIKAFDEVETNVREQAKKHGVTFDDSKPTIH